MKKHKKLLIIIALLFTGGATTYAAINYLGLLDNIQQDFNTVLNWGQGKEQKVAELEQQLEQNNNDSTNLQAEIDRLKQDIQQAHADRERAVADKQAEIDQKQIEIGIKQTELNAKQQELDAIRNELNQTVGSKQQLEQRIVDLEAYTSGVVEGLGE